MSQVSSPFDRFRGNKLLIGRAVYFSRWVVSWLLIYGISPDFFLDSKGYYWFSSLVTRWLPGVDNAIGVSHRGDIAAVYFPIMVVVSILSLSMMIGTKERQWYQRCHEDSFVVSVIRTLITLVYVVGIGYYTFVINTGELKSMPHTTSLVSLFLIGPIGSGGGFWCGVAIYVRAMISFIARK